ncbi:MAG TPA: DUF1292 domain-containing protein [Lachnospiraceae bacterium]|nr:DUF1292 domain-containing protein [Lachnospiraceae bacterium]
MGFEDDFEEFETIMLTDEEGKEVEFAIIDAIETEGQSYILLLEAELLDDENAEAMILKKIAEDGEEVNYELIEDDAEFDKIAELFQNGNDEYDVEIED